MTFRGLTKFNIMIAGLMAVLFAFSMSLPLMAQPAAVGYDKAHEITVSGTIQETVPQPALGGPAGLHLMIAGAQGMVDAHVGPYLAKETQEALHAGTPVLIVGSIETVHGKSYLLVRQVTFGGTVVNVRTVDGMLIRVRAPRASHHEGLFQEAGKSTASNGGAR